MATLKDVAKAQDIAASACKRPLTPEEQVHLAYTFTQLMDEMDDLIQQVQVLKLALTDCA